MSAVLYTTGANTHLLPGEAMNRRDRNRAYMMSLKVENILRAHYLEAGLIRMNDKPEEIHWGWDSPTSEILGTFCGHWLMQLPICIETQRRGTAWTREFYCK